LLFIEATPSSFGAAQHSVSAPRTACIGYAVKAESYARRDEDKKLEKLMACPLHTRNTHTHAHARTPPHMLTLTLLHARACLMPAPRPPSAALSITLCSGEELCALSGRAALAQVLEVKQRKDECEKERMVRQDEVKVLQERSVPQG